MVRVHFANQPSELPRTGNFFAIELNNNVAGLDPSGLSGRFIDNLFDGNAAHVAKTKLREVLTCDFLCLPPDITAVAVKCPGKRFWRVVFRCWSHALLRISARSRRDAQQKEC